MSRSRFAELCPVFSDDEGDDSDTATTMLPGSQSMNAAQLCADSNTTTTTTTAASTSSKLNASAAAAAKKQADPSKQDKSRYRIVVMGSAGVGKSAIISQFLYDNFQFEYNQTVEELHQGEYDLNGVKLTLDILDTAGAYSFPAMRRLAISTGDAFVLVYSVDDEASFEAVTELREQILGEKGTEDVPIVIVANKVDVAGSGVDVRRTLGRVTAESIVCVEWGNGYVEASAKDNVNIVGIFKEILRQSKVQYALSPAVRRRRLSTPSALTPRKKKTERPTRAERSSCS